MSDDGVQVRCRYRSYSNTSEYETYTDPATLTVGTVDLEGFFECVITVAQDPNESTLYGFAHPDSGLTPYGNLVPNKDVLGISAWTGGPNLALGNLLPNPEGITRNVYCPDLGLMAELPWDSGEGIWIDDTGNAASIGAHLISNNGQDVDLFIEEWEGSSPEPDSFQITVGTSGSNRGWSRVGGYGTLVPDDVNWSSILASTSFNRVDLSPNVDSPEIPDPIEAVRTFSIPGAGLETTMPWFSASWVWRITDVEENGQAIIDYFINNVDETFEILIGPIEYT